MAASAPAGGPALVDPGGWSHYWRKGGPMQLAELTSKWSHPAGGRHRRGHCSGAGRRPSPDSRGPSGRGWRQADDRRDSTGHQDCEVTTSSARPEDTHDYPPKLVGTPTNRAKGRRRSPSWQGPIEPRVAGAVQERSPETLPEETGCDTSRCHPRRRRGPRRPGFERTGADDQEPERVCSNHPRGTRRGTRFAFMQVAGCAGSAGVCDRCCSERSERMRGALVMRRSWVRFPQADTTGGSRVSAGQSLFFYLGCDLSYPNVESLSA